MRDKTVETKLRLLTLQLDNWKKLHDVITYGLDKARPIISAEQERQFTEIQIDLRKRIFQAENCYLRPGARNFG